MLRNESIRETQLSYDLTPVWNLSNKTNEPRGEKREREREKQIKKQTLNYSEQTVTRGVGVGAMGEIGDGI